MADENLEHTDNELLDGVKLETGKVYEIKRTIEKGKIKFQLLCDGGCEPRKDQDFTLTGHGVEHSGKTDGDGKYEHADEVLFGEYNIQVGECGMVTIQADAPDASPQIVTIPEVVVETPPNAEGSPADEPPEEDEDDASRPLPLTGSVGSKGDNKPEDVKAVKQKLKDLGYDWIEVNETCDSTFIRAIKLFQSIKNGRRSVAGDGRVDKDGDTHAWLEASNAPKWMLMTKDGTGFKNVERENDADNHDWGTDWLDEVIKGAGQHYEDNYRKDVDDAALIEVNDASQPQGTNTPDHAGHETGLDVDIRVPRTDGKCGTTCTASNYDRTATRAMIDAFLAQPNVKSIYFNDSTLIGESRCSYCSGHADHLHVNVKPPARAD